jgi:ParB family chromosome partitioning protein
MGEAIGAALARGDKAADIAKKLGRPKSVIAEYSALQEMPPFLRALADTTAIRTLYELYQGWKADPAKVEAFVADSDGTGIRRAAARELVRGADAVNKRPAPAPAATPIKVRPDELRPTMKKVRPDELPSQLQTDRQRQTHRPRGEKTRKTYQLQ